MLSERIFPTFPSEILPENASTLAYGPYGTVAIASGSLINFAFISNQNKSSNNVNPKEIKPMFSISIGLNPVTALKFDTNKQFSADPILYIGDSAGNIFIYNYQKHEYLAVYSPNGHWKDDRYVHVQQIEIDFLPDSDSLDNIHQSDDKINSNEASPNNNKSSKIYKNKNIIVLFKSKKLVSYSIIQEGENTENIPDNEKGNDFNIINNDSSDELPIKTDNDSNDNINANAPKANIRQNNSSYNNSFYKSNVNSSIDSISSALNFSVNWVIDLDSEMTNFSIDPFTNKKIFLYNKNKDNSFIIINLEEHNGSFSSISSQKDNSSNIVLPKVSFSSSLNKYDFKSFDNNPSVKGTEIIVHQYSTIQCAQFSRHIQNHIFILTEHVLILYNIDLDLFTRVNLTNIKSQKSAHFDRFIQFETDHRKLLIVYKTGAISLFSLNSLDPKSDQKMNEGRPSLVSRRRRSVSDYFVNESAKHMKNNDSVHSNDKHISIPGGVQIATKVHASDDHSYVIRHVNDMSDSKSNFSFKAISELKHIVQSQQFVSCVSPPFEADHDDILVFLFHPFGIALFDISRMKIVSCCPLFSDKTTCYSTNDKFVAYGSSQGDIRIRSIFDNTFFFSLHVLDDPIQFISISTKVNHLHLNMNNELNNIHIYFGSEKKVGEFCFDTRKLTFFRSPLSFSVRKVIGSHSGGLIVQRNDETAGVFINGSEVFLSLPENDKIIDICFNEKEVDEDDQVGQDERGSFMILRKNNIIELYKYNKYTKYSFTDNNYNCSNFNFLNDNSSVSAAFMKRRIIAHLNSASPNLNSNTKIKEKEKETKFAESTCIALSGVDFALGFNDGSVFLLKTNDQTFAKRVEVLSSVPIVRMKYSNMKANKVLFCLTGDKILCEVNLSNNEITSKVTLSHVDSFSIINSSFIMVKNETSNVNNIDTSNNNNNNNNNSNTSANSSNPSNANITSVSSKTNISSISSKSNLNSLNNKENNEDEAKANIMTPYGDVLIYPFPVLSKYKKVSIKRTRSILTEESSSSNEDKKNENIIDEDSSYSLLEKNLSFPILTDILINFIINNPVPQILKELNKSNINSFWFLFLPSIFDVSNKKKFFGYLLRKNGNKNDKNLNKSACHFGSPSNLPYSTDVGRDFWMLLLGRPSMRQECLYASGEGALEYEVALSRILEGASSSLSNTNSKARSSRTAKRLMLSRHLISQNISMPFPLSMSPTKSSANSGAGSGGSGSSNSNSSSAAEKNSSQTPSSNPDQSAAKKEKNYSMELFYALVYAHRYDEATNALSYNPDSDSFMYNTILAAALLGFSEFDISSQPTKSTAGNSSSSSSLNLSDAATTNSSSKTNVRAVPSFKSFADNNDNDNSNSLSMSAREQQYAVIKHAATQMIMLSTVTGRLIDGANLLRLSQLDSFAASILIQAGQLRLAMKFIRGMKSKPKLNLHFQSSMNDNANEKDGEKAGFCFEIGAKCYKNHDYKNAIFFFLSANEYFLALHSFFMFATSNFPSIFSSSSSHFNVHYSQAICDIYFLKLYLNEVGLLNEPLQNEKDEVLRKKKLEKLGNLSNSPLLNVVELNAKIDMEFKVQINHLGIDENLFFSSE